MSEPDLTPKDRPNSRHAFRRSGLKSGILGRFGKEYRYDPETGEAAKGDVAFFVPGQTAKDFWFSGWDDYVAKRPLFDADVMFLSGMWGPGISGKHINTAMEGGLTRTNENIEHRDEPAICSVDFDVKSPEEVFGLAYGPTMPSIRTAEDFRAALLTVVPELADARMLVYASSSGNIRRPDGSLLKDEINFRCDIHVASGLLIAPLLALIHIRSLAAGFACYGFITTTEFGRPDILIRSMADQALARPTQPDFASPALVGGLTQDRMWTAFGSSPVVSVPEVSTYEKVQRIKTEAALRRALEPERAEFERVNFEAAVDRKVEGGKSREEATEETRRRFEDQELHDDDLIYGHDGTPITVGEFRKSWTRGMRPLAIPCPDRGPGYSKTGASVNWGIRFATPVIISHASSKKFTIAGTPLAPQLEILGPAKILTDAPTPPIEEPKDLRKRSLTGERGMKRPGPVLLDRRPTGFGKTEEAVRQSSIVLDFIDGVEDSGERVWFNAPNHRLTEEAEKRYKAASENAVLVWKGTSQPDEHGDMLCPRPYDVEAAVVGGGKTEDACGTKENRCPHYSNCGKRKQDHAARALSRERATVITAGNRLLSHRPPPLLRLKNGMPEGIVLLLDEFDFIGYVQKTVALDRQIAEVEETENKDLTLDKLVYFSARRAADMVRGWEVLTPPEDATLTKAMTAISAAMHEMPKGRPTLRLLNLRQMDNLRADWDPRRAAQIMRRLVIDISKRGREARAGAVVGNWEAARALAAGKKPEGESEEVIALSRIYHHNRNVLAMAGVFDAIAQSMDDAVRRDDDLLLGIEFKIDEGGQRIEAMRREPVSFCWDMTPIRILDATAEPEIVKRWFKDAEIVDADGIAPIDESNFVTQIEDSAFSYSTIHNGHDWARRVQTFVTACAFTHAGQRDGKDEPEDPGYDVGVGLPKDLLARIEDLGGLPANVGVVTFGTEVGLNELQNVRRFIMVSRTLLPNTEAERLAEVIFGERMQSAGYEYQRAKRLVWQDGKIMRALGPDTPKFEVPVHPDPKVEMIRWGVCEGRAIQIIGRPRLNRRKGVIVDVLTNVPVDVPVARFGRVEDFKRAFDDEDVRLAAIGVWFEGKQDATLRAVFSGRAWQPYRDETKRLAGLWKKKRTPTEEEMADRESEAREKAIAAARNSRRTQVARSAIKECSQFTDEGAGNYSYREADSGKGENGPDADGKALGGPAINGCSQFTDEAAEGALENAELATSLNSRITTGDVASSASPPDPQTGPADFWLFPPTSYPAEQPPRPPESEVGGKLKLTPKSRPRKFQLRLWPGETIDDPDPIRTRLETMIGFTLAEFTLDGPTAPTTPRDPD